MTPRFPNSGRGVTLLELIIAITLVAALSAGMLMAMRTSLTALEKTQARLEDNRRTMGVQQLILRQVGGILMVADEAVAELVDGAPVPHDELVEGLAPPLDARRDERPGPAQPRRL